LNITTNGNGLNNAKMEDQNNMHATAVIGSIKMELNLLYPSRFHIIMNYHPNTPTASQKEFPVTVPYHNFAEHRREIQV
jgi:hypothetical protein